MVLRRQEGSDVEAFGDGSRKKVEGGIGGEGGRRSENGSTNVIVAINVLASNWLIIVVGIRSVDFAASKFLVRHTPEAHRLDNRLDSGCQGGPLHSG